MLRKSISLPLLLAALIAFTSPALAGEWKKGSGKDCDKTQKKDCDNKKKDCDKAGYVDKTQSYKRSHKFDILKFADKLDLSDKQVSNIKEIRSAHEKQKIMLGAEVDVMELELKELHRDQSKGIDVLSKKIREIEAKKGDLRIAKHKMMRDIGDVMTKKQRKQFREIFAKMKAGKK